MTIKERAHNFATDYAPFSDHTNLEIGYVKGAEEQKQIDIDKATKWIEYYNNNGGSLFDGWKDDFVKAMEE